MDRVLLPQDSLKKLGLLKINLLPKITTLRGKLFTSYLRFYITTDLRFQEKTRLIMIQFIAKQFFLQEKNLIYAGLANNIRSIGCQIEESGRMEGKNSPLGNRFIVLIMGILR
jgi:hypothetical protein